MKKFLSFILIIILYFNLFSQDRTTVKSVNFFYNIKNEIIYPITESQTHIRFLNTPAGTLSIYPDVRILPSNINQSTISAVLHPTNPNIILVGANTDLGVGYYITLNGGINWFGNNLLPGSFNISSNPAVAIAINGFFHYNYLDNFLVSDRSTNSGTNWLGRVNIPANSGFDKNHIAIDINSSSPYSGRIYVAYTKWVAPYPIMISYSTNNGYSFTAEQQIGAPQSNHIEQGANLQIGPNGEVYCIWATPNLLNNNIEDKIGFTKSINGGINWITATTPITINGIRGTLLNTNIRVNSFPSMAVDRTGGVRNGYIYICWAQRNLAPAGTDADICFTYSSNGGTSWATPIRVNDDALNNGKQQFSPWISIDQATGLLSIIFYDTRDVATQDSCHTYLAMSNNGGINWTNFKISSNAQRPTPLSGYATGYYSDYIGVVSHNGIVHAFWTDNRTGKAQVYYCKITVGPVIIHSKIKDSESTTGPYPVSAQILPIGAAINPTFTKVFYGIGSFTDSILLINTSGNNWTGSITGNGVPSRYIYYLRAVDNDNKISYFPAGAPTSYLEFFTGPDTAKPQIVHSPLVDTLKTYWPLTVSAYITDNIGIDSAWVRWYRNNTSTGIKQFKLNNTSGTIYSAAFNSTQSEVNYGDSIFYRIFARDNSSNHNTDSTQLYQFKISNTTNIYIGNGTIITSYPFSTFYTDARTNILYTANEIISAGGSAGFFTKIGFNFASASPITMNALTIRIKQTSNTTVTGFTNSGWTDIYYGNYTVPGTGWQYFNFNPPFEWNGTSNILFEVCFDNSTYGSNSQVYSSNISNMVWEQHADLTSGSGCTDLNSGNVQNARPNISLTINAYVGIKKLSSETPVTFELKQNYPNPFNNSTRINFLLPIKSYVTLKIFDILGREVATLFNSTSEQVLEPGIYTIDWNADGLSSGVYFYRILINSADGSEKHFSETKRMVLVK
ncbi:MAG: T9SS type A sorting domain-containing protein [Ignavibacteria bacterium]|nr:T9SS type A sorting domain-containing protein [Ignavibacteria bacterium]